MAETIGEILHVRVVAQQPFEDLAFVLWGPFDEVADGIHDESVLARQSAFRYMQVLTQPAWRHHLLEPLIDSHRDARYSRWHAVSMVVFVFLHLPQAAANPALVPASVTLLESPRVHVSSAALLQSMVDA
jgi:hypothetical protein